jgi:hypothetical protein
MRIIQFPASSLDLDAENYIQRVEVADGQALEDGLKTIISELFVSLKSANILSTFQVANLLAGPRTLPGNLVPLLPSLSAQTALGTVSDWVVNRKNGLTGNGTNNSINTNLDNSNTQQNSKHVCYGTSALSTNGSDRYVSTSLVTGATRLGSVGTSGFSRLCTTTADTFTASTGFTCATRTNSASYNLLTGSSVLTFTQPSQAMNPSPTHVFSQPNAAFCNPTIQYYIIGTGLTTSAALLFKSAMDTYISALQSLTLT